jgi:peptidoglycan/xylan/chitin deacetylase (PgdA/CDA1 family)
MTESPDVTSALGPIPWPRGYAAAASLTFDLDAEAVALSTDPASASRMSVMSHQSYGPLVGVPRVLSMLARNNVRATFVVPGFTANRYPEVVRSVADAGHEIAHNTYLHERVPIGSG